MAIELCYKQFGLRVRQLREALGLTQAELAKRVGLERTSIANIEAGKQRILLHDVELFATAFTSNPKFMMKGIWS